MIVGGGFQTPFGQNQMGYNSMNAMMASGQGGYGYGGFGGGYRGRGYMPYRGGRGAKRMNRGGFQSNHVPYIPYFHGNCNGCGSWGHRLVHCAVKAKGEDVKASEAKKSE